MALTRAGGGSDANTPTFNAGRPTTADPPWKSQERGKRMSDRELPVTVVRQLHGTPAFPSRHGVMGYVAQSWGKFTSFVDTDVELLVPTTDWFLATHRHQLCTTR